MIGINQLRWVSRNLASLNLIVRRRLDVCHSDFTNVIESIGNPYR